MFDIVALGETLIDFTPDGKNTQGSQLYAQNPGGAPANVLAMYAKLGGRAAFIGKVGMDAFGSFLEGMMQAAHIVIQALCKKQKMRRRRWRLCIWMPMGNGASAFIGIPARIFA